MRSSPSRRALALWLSLAVVSVVHAGANLRVEAARARARSVREVDYTLELDLRAGSSSYQGEVLVEFRLEEVPGRLHLDFQGEEVLELRIGGRAVAAPRFAEHRIELPVERLAVGANRVRVRYRCDFDTDGAGLHKVVDPADQREYLYTQFEPFDANRMFPCFDQPDLKASYQLTVTAPRDWEVVTNGAEVSAVAEGTRRRRRFARTARFSTYLVALCAGPYARWVDTEAGFPSRMFTTQSMAAHADPEEIFEVTRQGMAFYPRYFELEYPFGKYDQVFVPQFNWGAMENVGCVILNDRMIFRSEPTRQERMRRANTILHEMAHMWFGDIVTMQWWNDIWLNESFATYMAYLGLVEATEFTDAWEAFSNRTKGWAYWQDQLPTTHPIETDVPDTDTTFTNFDGITYGKGASVLKQLAFFLGPESFQEGVAAYLRRFAWGNARRADFIEALAEVAETDLGSWTELWLQRSGVNTLRPGFLLDGGRIREFWIDQEAGNGDGLRRPHRLKVALYRRSAEGGLERYEQVSVRVEGMRTRIPRLQGRPAPVFVDANDGDHAFAKVFLDPGSLDFARRHLELLPGSFLRGKVWRTLWFMVRDGVLPADDYLDLVMEKIGFEEEVRLVDGLLDNAVTALHSYLPASLEDPYRVRLRELCAEQLRGAAPGSDAQKRWFDVWVELARAPAELDELLRVLDGERSFEGLEVDQERRWDLVRELVAHRHPEGGARAAAEEERDPTERGVSAAYRVRVSRPDPAVKAEAWEDFTVEEDLPLNVLRAGMTAFWNRDRPELLRPYRERYFQALPDVASRRANYFASAFASRLFPGVLVEPETAARTRRALDELQDLPPAVRRALVEELDEMERALRLRELVGP